VLWRLYPTIAFVQFVLAGQGGPSQPPGPWLLRRCRVLRRSRSRPCGV